jgi:hypothetical protein
MLRVAATGSYPIAMSSRLRGLRGDFAGLLASGTGAAGTAAATALDAAGSLLAIQDEAGDPPPRHRRPATPPEAAEEALGLLRDVQRGLLGGAAMPLARLEEAAARAEHLAGRDAETRRLCAPIALRLRLEIAKRAPPDRGPAGSA